MLYVIRTARYLWGRLRSWLLSRRDANLLHRSIAACRAMTRIGSTIAPSSFEGKNHCEGFGVFLCGKFD